MAWRMRQHLQGQTGPVRFEFCRNNLRRHKNALGLRQQAVLHVAPWRNGQTPCVGALLNAAVAPSQIGFAAIAAIRLRQTVLRAVRCKVVRRDVCGQAQ